jgi:hypothetical protein
MVIAKEKNNKRETLFCSEKEQEETSKIDKMK